MATLRPTAFLDVARAEMEKQPPHERVRHFREFEKRLPVVEARAQSSRCMGCGVPFCHTGCPLGNRIPDWNDAVARDGWERASALLHATNNFPEITGRVCPAPCEEACVVHLRDEPVSIKAIERAIADRAMDVPLVPQRAARRTGKKVAIVGSGPAGLAAAQQLARAGHAVTVLERADRLGGLLRYGIPDFKLEKQSLDRRLDQMRAEGVDFRTGIEVRDAAALRADHDAVLLAIGATKPRDLPIEGRDLARIHFAMDYLVPQNRANAGDSIARIDASGKRVVILGGGDTGSDCVGTAHRQGAASVTQIELLPQPPDREGGNPSWPSWPWVMRTSSSQEEGGERAFALRTLRFLPHLPTGELPSRSRQGPGEGTELRALEIERVAWTPDRRTMTPIEGTRRELECDLVLLALGFVGPEETSLGSLARDARGNVLADTDTFATSAPGIFACGDARRGQSLVVWAIWEGRQAAASIDAYLVGETTLDRSPYAFAP
jgi:glutamate synthase (NADPH/NADH) small chain